jgi:Cu2+-containing amine oxidase
MNHLPTMQPVLRGIVILLALTSPATHAGALDPLDPKELARAASQATLSAAPTPSTRRQATANTISTPPANELLLIERHINNKGNTARLADVYTYDYATNQTIITVVDLDTNTTLAKHYQQNLQLPLTDNELKRAADLIFNDDEQRPLLNAEFKRITGKTLSDPKQLHIKAFVFHASSLPEQLNAASQECGVQRCAQVLLYTVDSVVFEVSPIVNLSANVITQSIGF